MSGLYFSICGASVGDMLVVQQSQCVDRHLVNVAGKARDPGTRGQFEEPPRAVIFSQELYEYGLHESFLRWAKYTLRRAKL